VRDVIPYAGVAARRSRRDDACAGVWPSCYVTGWEDVSRLDPTRATGEPGSKALALAPVLLPGVSPDTSVHAEAGRRTREGAWLGCATPYFSVNLGELRARVAAFERAFPGARIHYALKANSEPIVIETLAAAGCGFEAASWHEIDLLLDLGIAADRIIYGTAVKSPNQVRLATNAGVSTFAADSREELAMLGSHAPGSRVLLRAQVDDSHSVFKMSAKFGAPIGDLPALMDCCLREGLRPWGVSFNVGSQATRADAWSTALTALRSTVNEWFDAGIQLAVIDLGGGFPADYLDHVDTPGLDSIGELVYEALGEWSYQPSIILEPGRGIVATSTTLTTSVVARIDRGGRPWLYLDGGVYNALFEAMVHQGLTRYPVRRVSSAAVSPTTIPFVLAGPTGDGLDVVADDCPLPVDMAPGDVLVFSNAGAYTLAMTSTFNGFPKPSVVVAPEIHALPAAVAAHTGEPLISWRATRRAQR
jgi:ornithine decarboxylase